jgi:SAM-dependent methyltransferase
VRAQVPWWLRISAKLLLSRLPIPDAYWQRLGLFRHGAMDDASYPIAVFRFHARRTGLRALDGIRVLELGPGDSVATAVISAAHRCTAVLVDAGDFATRDLDHYRTLAESLSEDGLPAPDLSGVRSVEDILERCGAEYLTNGLASLESIEDSSIDLIFSQAVLEHIRLDEFEPTLMHLSRILAPGGISSHRVDLRDHLGGSLNNLRFSPRLWESRFFAQSGFYTNRLGLNEMKATFEGTHDRVDLTVRSTWEALPLNKARMHRSFRMRDTQDLLVSGFDALLHNELRQGSAH